MRVHGIHQLSGLRLFSHPRLSSFHVHMFHGKATRGGKPLHVSRDVWYSNDCRIPLEIVRAGNYVPDVFESRHWVVSEAVKERLNWVPSIEFLPVSFVKLVEFPVHAPGDFSWYDANDTYRRRDATVLLEKLPDVPAYHESVGSYYELLAPRICDIAHSFPSTRTVEFHGLRDPEEPDDDMYDCDISEQMLDRFPMLISAAHVLRDDVYQAVRQFVDWEYFLHDEVEL